MIDQPPRMDEEALYESHREKVIQRLVWLKNNMRKDYHAAIAVLVEAGKIPSLEMVPVADRILNDPKFADIFAEKFEIPTDKLLSKKFVSQEDFLGEDLD